MYWRYLCSICLHIRPKMDITGCGSWRNSSHVSNVSLPVKIDMHYRIFIPVLCEYDYEVVACISQCKTFEKWRLAHNTALCTSDGHTTEAIRLSPASDI